MGKIRVLQNKTKISDETLERVLREAGKSVGARVENVPVKVNYGYRPWCGYRGLAHQCDYVADWLFKGCKIPKSMFTMQHSLKYNNFFDVDGGYFTMTIPNPDLSKCGFSSHITDHYKREALDFAESVFAVAVHEYSHIKDYQKRTYYPNRREEKKKRHDNRPWEKVANNTTKRVMKRLTSNKQEIILALALEIEELNGANNK